ncbi:MAG: iron dicitrate transport regulator FecR, partial [Oxalobacteraceae bacterium]
MALDDHILEQATAWAVRTGDPAFEEWDDFTLWLEGDPAHGDAYALVTARVADAVEALPLATPEPLYVAHNDDEPSGFTRRRWLGGAVAAVLTLTVGIGLWQQGGGPYEVETAPGETQVIKLADGGSITLGGGTRVSLDRQENPTFATLEDGQALFTIRHDDDTPFRVAVGENELVDIGTVFDVSLSQGLTSVAVSEGAVMFNPQSQNVRIDPGYRLSSERGSGSYSLSAVPLDQVGEWTQGRLTFQEATLGRVAADLSRATGVT